MNKNEVFDLDAFDEETDRLEEEVANRMTNGRPPEQLPNCQPHDAAQNESA